MKKQVISGRGSIAEGPTSSAHLLGGDLEIPQEKGLTQKIYEQFNLVMIVIFLKVHVFDLNEAFDYKKCLIRIHSPSNKLKQYH